MIKDLIKTRLPIILSIALGIIFLSSGILKSLTVNDFISVLNTQYQIGVLSLFAPVIIIIELYIGLQLLLLKNIKRNAIWLLLFIIFLTGVYTYGQFQSPNADCNCFGSLKFFETTPIIIYLRNLLLSAIAFYLYQSKPTIKPLNVKKIEIAIILTFTFIAGLHTDIKNTSSIVNTFWFNNNIILNEDKIEDINSLNLLQNSKNNELNLLFFMSESCNYCLNSIENLKSYKRLNIVDNIIIIIVKNREYNSDFLSKNFGIDKTQYIIKSIDKREIKKISNILPTALFIKNNKIIIEQKGILPSVPVFLKTHQDFSKH